MDEQSKKEDIMVRLLVRITLSNQLTVGGHSVPYLMLVWSEPLLETVCLVQRRGWCILSSGFRRAEQRKKMMRDVAEVAEKNLL